MHNLQENNAHIQRLQGLHTGFFQNLIRLDLSAYCRSYCLSWFLYLTSILFLFSASVDAKAEIVYPIGNFYCGFTYALPNPTPGVYTGSFEIRGTTCLETLVPCLTEFTSRSAGSGLLYNYGPIQYGENPNICSVHYTGGKFNSDGYLSATASNAHCADGSQPSVTNGQCASSTPNPTPTPTPTPVIQAASEKDNGPCCEAEEKSLGKTSVGNPINVGTGNKFQREDDYVGAGNFPLAFSRFYNSSDMTRGGVFRVKWRSTFDRKIDVANAPASVSTLRHDGRVFTFNLTSGSYASDPDVTARLAKLSTGWQYINENDETETYNINGLLQSITSRAGITQTLTYNASGLLDNVTDTYGRTLRFVYNGKNALSSLTDPAGNLFSYAYDSIGMLTSVTYPDQKTRQYVYEAPFNKALLTGIIDENNQRYATWAYDIKSRAISSQHANGAEAVSLIYNTNGTTYVTDAAGTQRSYSFSRLFGVTKNTGIDGTSCDHCGANSVRTYDANGFQSSRTDFKGNKTNYTYNARGLETSRTEAVGKPEIRTIGTEWHATFRLPTKITEPGRTTNFVYDASGNLKTKTVTDGVSTRTSTYEYNTRGQLTQMDGPRTDVVDITKYSYDDATGNLLSVTNALNHVTKITEHDLHGRPLTITDPNGLVTKLEYDLRGRITKQIKLNETTGYEYDPAGMLSKVTRPDSSYIQYVYDAAHRLTEIHDTENNQVVFKLDNMGNRTEESVYDSTNQRVQKLNREYNTLNRLTKTIGATGQTTNYLYDNNGNLTSVTDPLTHNTLRQYDALNRLAKITDANTGVTDFTYTPLDKLDTVTDPRRLATKYVNDGLDNVTQTTSPDSGVQKSYFDAAGNRISQVDAKGQITGYQYDALNRLVLTTRADLSVIGYEYDLGANGIGRLTRMVDTSGSTAWQYDLQGRVTQKMQKTGFGKQEVTLITNYQYDSFGWLNSQSPPSGATIQYGYNTNGRVNLVTVNGVPIMSGIQYHPFGPIKSWNDRNSKPVRRSFDLNGRMTATPLGSLAYDDANRITNAYGRDYTYDKLDWLTGDADNFSNYGYQYDANGNRTSGVVGGGSSAFSVAPTNNRLTSVTLGGSVKPYTYDANGSLTNDGNTAYTYDIHGRLVEANGGRYSYNGLGERVAKLKGKGTLGTPPPPPILLCDVNGDGRINNKDIAPLKKILAGKAPPVPMADCNGDGVIDAGDLLDLQDLVGVTKPRKGPLPLTINPAQALAVDSQPLPAGIQVVGASGSLLTNLLDWIVFTNAFTKTLADPDLITTYSEQKFEGEYQANGQAVQEVFWLGDLLVAVLQSNGNNPTNASLYSIDADHLNTPRQLQDPSGTVVWSWSSAHFGALPANEDPDGDGKKVSFNLRFPGQYYDAETGLHYNYFRDYSPQTGRYVQSDPIGLAGGINTFGYVGGNPMSKIDPLGLFTPAYHKYITEQAMGGNKRCKDLPGLVAGVDSRPGSQEDFNAYQHAMRDGTRNQSVSDAQRQFNNYINDSIAKGTMYYLASALHAVQDSAAAGHKGFQPWTGGLPSFEHFDGDANPSAASVAEAIQKSRDILNRFPECGCE